MTLRDREYQLKLLDQMDRIEDSSLTPEDPNQSPHYVKLRQEYLRVDKAYRDRAQQPMDSQADIYAARNKAEAARRASAEPGMWTDVKNITSDALRGGAQVTRGIPGVGFALRQLSAIDRANAGDSLAAGFKSYLGDPEVEASLADVVRGVEGSQEGYDVLLPGFQESRQASRELVDPGVANIHRAFGQEGIGSGFKSLWDDPTAVYNLLGSTLGRSPASTVLGAGGAGAGALAGLAAPIPGGAAAGGIAGGALGSGAGGYIDERTGGIIRMLEEKGFDVANPEHIQLLQENPEVFDLASDQANKRALAIGAFSAIAGAVSAGLGRVAAGPAINALGRMAVPARVGAAGGSIPISGVLESAGEYSAQRAAGQHTNWADVKLEGALGALMDAPITGVGMASTKFAPSGGIVSDTTRNLAAKEAKIIGEGLPFGGQINIVPGEVFDEEGKRVDGSAEFVTARNGQGEIINIHIDNLIRRSDGTRSGIRAQLVSDLTHELSGHQLVQKLITENPDYLAQAFTDHEDLILAWQPKSAYEDLGTKNDDILYEEWVAGLAEMDAKMLRRIELSIVNFLHKRIGKAATAKLIKSWDARNITVRNMAREHMKQIKDRRAAGEVQSVQTITPEEALAQDRPPAEDVTLRSVVEPGLEEDFDIPSGATQRATRYSRGNIQDPSRRKFMKQAAGAVAGAAVDPSILLEPATPTPPVAPPGFGGFGTSVSAIPEYEAAIQAGEMASPSGLVSDVASEAFDDFDFEADQETMRQEQADTQEKLDEYDAREAAEKEAETDAERYVETVDEIMNIYDNDASAIEAAQDGTLNDRIISYAAETTFTREELWEGVNERIDALAEDTATPARRFSRARKPKSETVQRDINEEKGKVNRRIAALDVEEAEKEERKNLLKRLQNIMGAPARKRGIDAGDQDVFKEQAAKIVAGDLEAVEAFMKPFEEKKTGSTETVYKADRRRALRAERIGKTDAEILKYRPKGAKHPMEGKMTYPFAMEEIDRQEKAGEITAEEAEIRRLAVNNVRRIFKGKAGQTVKRTITEAVYGIGAYEDLVPWSEVYTEEQTTEMGERAEIGQAEARRTRYDPTDLTDKERTDLLEAAETAEEKSILDAAEANPPYPDVDKFDSNQDPVFNAFQKTMLTLDTRAERLAFLRAPAEFKSETEEKEMIEFRKTLKTKKPYDERKVQEKVEKEKEDLISKAMAEGKFTELPPEDITKITYYQRSVVNIEPTQWDRMVIEDGLDPETAFEINGDAYTAQGELISDMEIIDPISVDTKRRQSVAKTPKERIDGQLNSLSKRNIDSGGFFTDQLSKAKALIGKLSRAAGKVLNTRPYNQLAKEVNQFAIDFPDSEVQVKSFFNETVKQAELKPWQVVRAEQIGLSKTLKEAMASKEDAAAEMAIYDIIDTLNETTGIMWSPDHIVSLNTGGLDFAWNLMPLPKSINEKLKHISIEDSKSPAVKTFFDYLTNKGDRTDTVYLLIDAAAEAGLINEAQVANAKESLKNTKFPESPILPSFLHGKKGMERLLATYDLHKIVNVERGDPGVAAFEMSSALPQIAEAEHKQTARRQSAAQSKDKDYTEHFNDGFWYTITSFLWGKPVQAIRDFNKSSRFGSKQGKITAADKIADLVQRAHSSTKRAEGLELGTDMMQDVSMRSGEFFTKLSRIFALATGRAGDIDVKINKQMTDYLLGRKVKFSSPQVKEAAIELKALLESVYKYGRDSTTNLKERLNLRGEGDTVLPRVWNIEYIATRKGKAAFLRVVNNVIRGRSDLDVTPEDLYEAVINSGGFVQGDWTNVKADQTRSAKDIAKDELIGEVLDSMPTSNMIDEGLVIEDLQALLPRFIQKAIERTEYSRRFGKSDELLRGMIDEALEQIRANNREVLKLSENKEGLMHIDEKKFTKTVWDMARILRNQYGYDMANMPTRKWLQRATNTETILKLPFVTLASIPEFFTPMLKGDVRPDKWFVDFMAGTAWAGYKGMNGLSKLIFNKHLPAMRKASQDIGGMGIISDVQLLRELGIADIQAMGDLVSTRYANPNFARGGLRGGAKGTLAGKIPKKVRAVFNMQTYMQGTLLTTITEMQQLMALRNFQRHMGRRLKFVHNNKGKPLKGRRARLMKQFTQDLADYGITGDINLDTSTGQAEFNAGALRFIDQVITRPNDATTAKIFKNPLTAPLVLFKRFITVYGNTLMTSIGNDFATKVDNTERAKQVAQVASVAMIMYGSVMFAEIIRGVLKGDLDEEDFKLMPKDFSQFMRRLDRTGLSSAPGAAAINLAFPYKRGWWDTTQSRIMNEILGPLGGDLTALGDALISGKNNAWERLFGQVVPAAKPLMRGKKKKKRVKPGYN